MSHWHISKPHCPSPSRSGLRAAEQRTARAGLRAEQSSPNRPLAALSLSASKAHPLQAKDMLARLKSAWNGASTTPHTGVSPLALTNNNPPAVARAMTRPSPTRAPAVLQPKKPPARASTAEPKKQERLSRGLYKSEVMRKIVEADGGNWYCKRKGTDARGRIRPEAVNRKRNRGE